MNKLENKSNNLKEILMAIADGKPVQFFISETWCDFLVGNTTPYNPLSRLDYKWRIKPDAFECVYDEFVNARFPAVYEINKDQAKHFWDAAMEHKDDE